MSILDGYYINLAASSERRERMECQLRQLNIDYVVRFQAIDGSAPSMTRPNYSRALSSGQYGCYSSHKTIISQSNPASFSLILEDDVELSLDFSTTLHQEQLPLIEQYDIVFLECLPTLSGAVQVYQNTKKFVRNYDSAAQIDSAYRTTGVGLLDGRGHYDSGATAYIVTPRGKRTILSALEKLEITDEAIPPIDVIYRKEIESGNFRAAICAPFLASPIPELNNISTIGYNWNASTNKYLSLTFQLRRLFFAGFPGNIQFTATGGLDPFDPIKVNNRDQMQKVFLLQMFKIIYLE